MLQFTINFHPKNVKKVINFTYISINLRYFHNLPYLMSHQGFLYSFIF